MLSLEVCLLCDEEGVGSGAGLSERSGLEAIFYIGGELLLGCDCRQRTGDGTYDWRQIEGKLALLHD
jgi:hypothetical protein